LNNILLLQGSEKYFIEQVVDSYKTKLQNPAFNLFVFTCDANIDEQKIYEACHKIPFMDDRIVIIVEGNMFINKLPILEEYILHPIGSTELILISETVDKRKVIYKNIKSKGRIIEFNKLSYDKFYSFTSNWFREKGYSISNELIKYICNKTGYIFADDATIHKVVLEYNKIISYCNGKNITLEIIDNSIHPFLHTNIFELIQYIKNQNLQECLCYVNELLTNNAANELQLIGLISRYFRILYKLKISTPEEIGLSSFMVKDFSNIDSIQLKELQKCIDILVEIKEKIVSGEITASIGIELLLVEISLAIDEGRN